MAIQLKTPDTDLIEMSGKGISTPYNRSEIEMSMELSTKSKKANTI